MQITMLIIEVFGGVLCFKMTVEFLFPRKERFLKNFFCRDRRFLCLQVTMNLMVKYSSNLVEDESPVSFSFLYFISDFDNYDLPKQSGGSPTFP